MSKAKQLFPATPESLTDQLGWLRAEKSTLDQSIKAAELAIRHMIGNNGAVNGDAYRLTINTCQVKNVAWKAITEKMEASPQMIAGNTSFSNRTTIKVTALLK